MEAKLLYNKKYSGILWAILFAIAFVACSIGGQYFFRGTAWYFFSSGLRLCFGFFILATSKKLYNKQIPEILSFKGTQRAMLAAIGFLIYFLYFVVVWFVGINHFTGLTTDLLLSQIALQQVATGFYEELNYRFLVLEGYFHGPRTAQRRLLYGLASSLLFGAVHVVTGWNLSTFLLTSAIGFSFAVIYLKSGNILIPMILHFAYDVFANLSGYIVWQNSALFQNMSSLINAVWVVMILVSLATIFPKEKTASGQSCQTANPPHTNEP